MATQKAPKAEPLVLTPEQKREVEAENRVWQVNHLRIQWTNETERLLGEIRRSTGNWSSGIIEQMAVSLAQRQYLAGLNRIIASLEEQNLITFSEGKRYPRITEGKIDEVLDLLDTAKAGWLDQYMNWYKPNSTSNIDVEISLWGHAALLQMIRALDGKF